MEIDFYRFEFVAIFLSSLPLDNSKGPVAICTCNIFYVDLQPTRKEVRRSCYKMIFRNKIINLFACALENVLKSSYNA